MTKRELAELVLKLLGLYAIVQSLPFFSYLVGALGALGYERDRVGSQVWMYISMSIPFALMAVAGVVLLTCSRGLASVLLKDETDAKLSTSLQAEQIQAIAFSVVAVLVFLLALPQLAQLIGSLLFLSSLRGPEGQTSQFVISAWQHGLSFAVQCGLAIVLFFGARGLANLWHRVQAGKYVKVGDVEPSGPGGTEEPPSASSSEADDL